LFRRCRSDLEGKGLKHAFALRFLQWQYNSLMDNVIPAIYGLSWLALAHHDSGDLFASDRPTGKKHCVNHYRMWIVYRWNVELSLLIIR